MLVFLGILVLLAVAIFPRESDILIVALVAVLGLFHGARVLWDRHQEKRK